jgi:hypothetical protein
MDNGKERNSEILYSDLPSGLEKTCGESFFQTVERQSKYDVIPPPRLLRTSHLPFLPATPFEIQEILTV